MSTENVAGIGFELTFDGNKLTSKIDAACDKVRTKFEKSFTQAGASATKAVQTSSDEINSILSDVERSAKSKAAAIAAIYRKQGDSQEEAFKKAWSHIERNSAKSAEKTKKSIKGISKQSKNTAEDLKNNFAGSFAAIVKKATSAFAAAFAVKEVVAFGKECIELGSDLQEVQNVVDVTFGSMSEKVDAFARSAAGSFGLSETMAKKFTGTFGAMAKAFGFTEQQAYDMGSSLTGLAGDVASFYNITQDEAYTKLKSVFTGETESLKDLGVVMTQTALDSYALANGFGKTTAAMSEAEKVALRYSFVQDQLSAASGDFQRTSGGWANQVRVMNLQLDSIKAKLGQGLITALTPVVKLVNVLLEKLSGLASAFQSFMEGLFGSEVAGSSVAESAIAAEKAAAGMTDSTGQTAENLEKANRFLAGFDKIQKVSDNLQSTGTDSIANFDFGVDTDNAETEIEESVGETTGFFQRLSKYLSDKFYPAIKKVTTKAEGLFTRLKTGFNTLWNKVIKPVVDFICGAFQDWWEIMQEFWERWAEPIFTELDKAVENTERNFKNLWQRVLEPIWEKFMEVVDELWTDHLEPLYRNYTDFCGHLVEGALQIYNEFVCPLRDWIINELGPVFADDFNRIMEEAGDFLGDVADAASELIDGLKGLIKFLTGTFTGDWELAWQGIVEAFEGTFGAIGKILENPINAVIADINEMLTGFTDGINAVIEGLNSLGANIPEVDAFQIPLLGEETDSKAKQRDNSRERASQLKVPALTSPPTLFEQLGEVPQLASGAYVKANTPQLAMIGDNRHQGELVSPEDKLQEMAVAAAKAAAGSGISKDELERVINNAVMRIVAALASLGFYVDGEQMAKAIQSAEQSIDARFNPVTTV